MTSLKASEESYKCSLLILCSAFEILALGYHKLKKEGLFNDRFTDSSIINIVYGILKKRILFD